MNQPQLIENLKSLFNIETTNAYPKKSFLKQGIPTIGCFGSELKEDFYYYNQYNEKYYKLPQFDYKQYPTEEFNNSIKYQIPCHLAVELKIEGVEEYKELEDAHIDELTFRDLCAILWHKPVSNNTWLNELIGKEYPIIGK